MQPRIYTYKITFEEVPYYYYGVHKEKYFNEQYWGSPITHKWCWEFYTPKKQIIEFFDFSDEGWEEAQKNEKRLIKTTIYDYMGRIINERDKTGFYIIHNEYETETEIIKMINN